MRIVFIGSVEFPLCILERLEGFAPYKNLNFTPQNSKKSMGLLLNNMEKSISNSILEIVI